eukprot:1146871-Pelagomonas_calceolata.AAC.5
MIGTLEPGGALKCPFPANQATSTHARVPFQRRAPHFKQPFQHKAPFQGKPGRHITGSVAATQPRACTYRVTWCLAAAHTLSMSSCALAWASRCSFGRATVP